MGSRPFHSHKMKLLFLVGLVGLSQGAYLPYLHYAVPTFKLSTVATGDSVPVAIGGYKAVAGEGGAVHEVPGLLPAPAVVKQEAEGGVSLTTGTGAVLSIGKRSASADPSVFVAAGYPYFGLPSAGPVPVAVGGYKAVGGEGGAVHEVAGVFPA